MPTDMDKAYGGYSTFRPQRNGEGEEEQSASDKQCQSVEKEDECEENQRELLAKWFAKRGG